ncbi:hypothetical protein [Streptomyces sp. NBRC 109706]|uniref:hypothetical protein n=1 Tax=Streptomyces sp. NBRC 109706 TaxID=1550035 RepID=UPI00131BE9D1|nr:hypothetical protein [Streptomyces sp. NBRC 109706]
MAVLDRLLSHGVGPVQTEQLAGRTVNVTLYDGTPEAVDSHREAGVDRVLLELPDHENPADARPRLDQLATPTDTGPRSTPAPDRPAVRPSGRSAGHNMTPARPSSLFQ